MDDCLILTLHFMIANQNANLCDYDIELFSLCDRCAFEGTPKYEQVSGKGFIVKKSWITECHSEKQLLPWRK